MLSMEVDSQQFLTLLVVREIRRRLRGKQTYHCFRLKLTLEGPFYKGAWVFSGRRTYFDKIFQNVPSIPPYYFYDIQSHIYSDLTPKDRLSLSFYNGVDDLLFETFGFQEDGEITH